MQSTNIVFVHGMFGWGKSEMGGLPYWGRALKVNTQGFNVHEASCGPVSSFHDRACEVAAQLKGSIVDYGKKHSDDASHDQLSDDYSGKEFFKDWSSENPVILIGHSAGAHTCLQLQQLLADDYWQWGSNADWIEAIIPISGVINGSTLPYMLGCNKQTGLLTGSIGETIREVIKPLALLTSNSSVYDFDLDQWIGEGDGRDLNELIKALNESEFANGGDNMAFDLTLQGCYKANQNFKTNPNTYYLSIVTEQTRNGSPELRMNPVLRKSAKYQGQKVDFTEVTPIPGWGSGDLQISKWRENDGAVSSISQKYPFTAGIHPVGGMVKIDNNPVIEKGKWYFENADSITNRRFDHLDVGFGYLSDFLAIPSHIELYQKIYRLLSQLR